MKGYFANSEYGAVVLPLKHPMELERSQCPSPSSSLDTNPLVWEIADRLVLSLLQDIDEDDDEDDILFDLPKPIPVHPAHVALVTPAAAMRVKTIVNSTIPRPHSAMW